ncbi:hypothetical protein CHH28_11005 [Bacterioplanes sanyensis]|uniref:DUF4174 domain-containing protein n=1 Tax=Bacterioplanes sanyensis TaxID=1249553 RepID=A0A222FLS2_9GAMM|nr:hypothetical protein [Bacterioplanes sanyensis]ASP39173.1 hypothetical protein CHH28_11005 [Bacterioplanes sanyensis]
MKTLQKKYLWITLTGIILLSVLFQLLPTPIDMNLDKVGNGKAALVFIYDPNLASSNEQSVEINKVRQQLGDSVNLLVAKAGDPTSADFRQQHQARPADILFFDINGELIKRDIAVIGAAELVTILTSSNPH